MIVYLPGVSELTASIEECDWPGESVMPVGLRDVVSPAAETLSVSEIVPAKPTLCSLIADWLDEPDRKVRLDGFAEIVKFEPTVSLRVTVWAIPFPEPFTVIE